MRTAKQRGRKKSLASSAAADFFPDSLPASTKAQASAPSPRPPRRLSRQASQAGERCSAPSLCAGISPLCPPHPCGCALFRGSEASPLCHPQSLPTKGLPSMWKPFLLHGSLPLVQGPSLFFCLCCFFFLLPSPGTWGVSCLLGGLRSFASVQWVFCRSSSTCRCISTVSVGRKVISASYSSAFSLPSRFNLFLMFMLQYFLQHSSRRCNHRRQRALFERMWYIPYNLKENYVIILSYLNLKICSLEA